MTRPRGDGGQLLLLALGFLAVAALLVAVVVDASAAFLAHRDLAAVADGTALAAAQEVDLAAYYAGGVAADTLPLGDVAGAATAYVERHAPAGTELVAVTLVDRGTAVEVVLRRRLRLRLLPVVLAGATTVEATATARLRLRP